MKFKLNVKCERKPEYQNYTMEQLLELDPEEYLVNSTVYSGDFEWEPLVNQEKELKTKPKMLYDNIIVAKLRENQEVEMEVYCSKNIGRVHAKWSPVATAYYRLKPHIEFEGEILGEDVKFLKFKNTRLKN